MKRLVVILLLILYGVPSAILVADFWLQASCAVTMLCPKKVIIDWTPVWRE